MDDRSSPLLVDVTRLMADMEDGRCLDEAARLRAALQSGDEIELARLLRAYGYEHASISPRTEIPSAAPDGSADGSVPGDQAAVIGLAVDVGAMESRVESVERELASQAREVAHQRRMIRYMIDHPNAS